jgi:GH24 family phage-related lysozyme (muramidase)
LPPDAQAAIVSLIYNRGSGLTDKPGDTEKRREEMRNIVPLVKAKDLRGIAAEFRKMKRLWDADKQPGLITRREREALLVENATWIMAPSEYIFI